MTENFEKILELRIRDVISARKGGYALDEIKRCRIALMWVEGMGIDIENYWTRFVEARGYE